MKSFYTSLICLLFSTEVLSQKLIVNWTKFIGAPNTGTVIRSTCPASDGGLIFTGFTNANNAGDIPATTLAKENIIVGKLNEEGKVDWLKLFGGSNDDRGYDICKSHDDGYIILSKVLSNDGDISDYKNGTDLWVLKIDQNGNKVWAYDYGSPFSEVPISIERTSDNGFIILASSTGNGDDVPSHHGSSQFIYDWFALKLDQYGNKQWAKSIGGTGDDYAYGKILQIDTSYFLIAGGASRDFDCDDNSWQGSQTTDYDCHVLKLDSQGNVMWNNSYGGSDFDMTTDAYLDNRDTTILIAGNTRSTDFVVPSGENRGEVWLLKINNLGNVVWSRKYGGADDDGNIVAISRSAEGYMITAETRSALGFGGQDLWVMCIDVNGTVVTDKKIGNTKSDFSWGICKYENGYFMHGSTLSNGFTEGKNFGNYGIAEYGYISKIEYFPTAVREETKNECLKLYPNPSNNSVVLDVGDYTGLLYIINTQGRVIWHKDVKQRSEGIQIDVTTWAKGIYYVTLPDTANFSIGFVVN